MIGVESVWSRQSSASHCLGLGMTNSAMESVNITDSIKIEALKIQPLDP